MELIGVSQKIRFIRTYLQVSRAELALLLKVAEAVIQALEEGQQELSTQMLGALVKEVNISVDWLLFDVGEMFLSPPLQADSTNGVEIVLAQKPTCPARYLDGQIIALEERFQKETYLPLKQIRVLLTKILNSPVDALSTTGLPDELPSGNWQDLSDEGKYRYFQQLQYRIQTGQQEFSNYFQKLIQLVGQRNF